MAEFEIECGRAARCAGDIQSLSRDVKKQEGRMADTIRRMRLQNGDYSMTKTLSGIADSLHRQQEQMQQYGSTLEHIVKTYEDTESELAAWTKNV